MGRNDALTREKKNYTWNAELFDVHVGYRMECCSEEANLKVSKLQNPIVFTGYYF